MKYLERFDEDVIVAVLGYLDFLNEFIAEKRDSQPIVLENMIGAVRANFQFYLPGRIFILEPDTELLLHVVIEQVMPCAETFATFRALFPEQRA